MRHCSIWLATTQHEILGFANAPVLYLPRVADAAGATGTIRFQGLEEEVVMKAIHHQFFCAVVCSLMAGTAAEIAMKLAKGEEYKRSFQTTSNGERLVPSVLENGVVVTRDNLKLTVVSEGYQKEEDIFK